MATLQSLDLTRRSATTGTPPAARQTTEVSKLIDVSKCIGCKACQVACMEWNDLRMDVGEIGGSYDHPNDLGPASWTVMRFSEVDSPLDNSNLEWLIRKDGCMHCSDPGCLKACPSPGAIVQYSNGIVDFISENCIGCGYCVKGCPFNIPRISTADNKAYKCTLCSDRVAVGQTPACVKACPTQALVFGSKQDMIDHAATRVADLKSRGYVNAGLYNPPGVGGTHVMYVLQHADKAPLYAGLAQNPRISPLVELWKGITKNVGMAAIGLAAAFGFVHYVVSGPNQVSREDDEAAAKLREGGASNKEGA